MKAKRLSRTTRQNLITYAIVLVAFAVVTLMNLTGSLSNSLEGQLVPICTYVMLAVSLNLTVGILGELSLGHAGFMSVGAFSAMCFSVYMEDVLTTPVRFALALLIGGIAAGIAGVLIGIPVLRLQGDYLAIVTLGFGEIVRLLLNNLRDITGGSQGVASIPRPAFFMELSAEQSMNYMYYLTFAAMLVTIVVVARLKNSRVGLALQALRDDEIASEAMGIDLRTVKLQAFALGSCWAGFAGVLLAARINFISPASFTFMDSAMVLSMVVLGGMGSIRGSVISAIIITVLPEALRELADFRMLIYALVLIVMMLLNASPRFAALKGKLHYGALVDAIRNKANKEGKAHE